MIIGAYPTRYIKGKWTGPTVLQVHATPESAGWKEARVEFRYANMSERDPDPAGTSGVEEVPGRKRAWLQNRVNASKTNMKSALDNPSVVDKYLATKVKMGRIFGPLEAETLPMAHISRFCYVVVLSPENDRSVHHDERNALHD